MNRIQKPYPALCNRLSIGSLVESGIAVTRPTVQSRVRYDETRREDFGGDSTRWPTTDDPVLVVRNVDDHKQVGYMQDHRELHLVRAHLFSVSYALFVRLAKHLSSRQHPKSIV
jgi:hypothetical protein